MRTPGANGRRQSTSVPPVNGIDLNQRLGPHPYLTVTIGACFLACGKISVRDHAFG